MSKEKSVSSSNGNKKNITEVLGPVDDLESYVKADWWRQIFNANYLRTDGDVVEDASITQNEIDLFTSIIPVAKDSTVLDLCCGQGRHTLEFAKRGYKNLFGLDRSHYLINRARNLNKKRGYNVTFKEGDARKLPFSTDKFDFVVIAGNSFGYFDSSQDDLKVLKEVRRILKPNAQVMIDITDGDFMRKNFESRSWEWIDKHYFVCRERSLSVDKQRLISREVITHVQKGVIADQFYGERLYSQDSIMSLLAAAGFTQVKVHTDLITQSQRNQDLGMMAKRIIVTGMAKKEIRVKAVKNLEAKSITVLMGDPQKSDIVKPNASFGESDLSTIQQLRNALASLKDYKVNYLDNHNTMLQDLIKQKNKFDFVFNLCDEGFNNDATKELHVPSYLEMLDIDYSGGSPQCLAYCYDKSLTRGVAKEMDIPVPEAFLIKPEDTNFIELTVDFPVIVKPNFGDSSFGITQKSVCYNVEDLEQALLSVREKMGYDKPVLVEQFLTGKDISVGIIGNPPESYQVLPIIQEDYSALPDDLPRICGYEAKWDPNSPYWKIRSVPADLSEDTERFLIASCLRLFERLKCRDYARFDWRLDGNGTPRLLEVNPNPGWCWDGHLAKMAKLADISYPEMLNKIIQAADERIHNDRRKRNANSIEPAKTVQEQN